MPAAIYQIKNLINNKIYIGSAKNFHAREISHIGFLSNNKHHNNHLQNAWNKYGKENFKFEILEIVEDFKELLKREQYWLSLKNSTNIEIGYNISPTAGNTLGTKRTAEQRLRLSISQKGVKRSEEAIYNMAQCKIGKLHTTKAKANMKKFSGTRDLDKWPCLDGSKCKCDRCTAIRRERNNTYNRKLYHAKTKSTYQQ